MENVTIEYLLKRINELEKKLEMYFNYLKIDNELDFVLKGTYIFKEDIEKITNGLY